MAEINSKIIQNQQLAATLAKSELPSAAKKVVDSPITTQKPESADRPLSKDEFLKKGNEAVKAATDTLGEGKGSNLLSPLKSAFAPAASASSGVKQEAAKNSLSDLIAKKPDDSKASKVIAPKEEVVPSKTPSKKPDVGSAAELFDKLQKSKSAIDSYMLNNNQHEVQKTKQTEHLA